MNSTIFPVNRTNYIDGEYIMYKYLTESALPYTQMCDHIVWKVVYDREKYDIFYPWLNKLIDEVSLDPQLYIEDITCEHEIELPPEWKQQNKIFVLEGILVTCPNSRVPLFPEVEYICHNTYVLPCVEIHLDFTNMIEYIINRNFMGPLADKA
jgi:hypothetical protein